MSLGLDSIMEKKDLMLPVPWIGLPGSMFGIARDRTYSLVPHFALQTMAFALRGSYNRLDSLSFLHL
jgi:hypothetical protein